MQKYDFFATWQKLFLQCFIKTSWKGVEGLPRDRRRIAEGSQGDNAKTSILCILFGDLYIEVIFSRLLLVQRRHKVVCRRFCRQPR